MKQQSVKPGNEIGWMEPFDCDVEEALDQISDDSQVRGKIRWMLMKLVGSDTEVIMRLKEQRDACRAALEVSRGQWIHSVNKDQCLAALALSEKRQ